MDVLQLQSWLGLAAGHWPPDHYALLGFPVGVCDPAAVEPRVMERMNLLRRYQLLQPELVTEGMNRLAQALITLTDPVGKATYDAELGVPVAPSALAFVAPRPAPAAPASPLVVASPVEEDEFFADDLVPDRGEMTQVIALPAGLVLPYELIEDREPPEALPLSLDDAPVPEVVEAVAIAPPVGIAEPASRRWIYARLALLRKALRAWQRLQPVLADPNDPIDRPGRVLILLEAAWGLRPLLKPLRGFVGVDQPGGIVVAVVDHPLILDTLRRLLPDQRQALAVDWRRGQLELQREYNRLRALSATARERPPGSRGGPTVLRWFRDVPELLLLVMAGLALGIALIRSAVTH